MQTMMISPLSTTEQIQNFDASWLRSIRPIGQIRHHLDDDYTYTGYLALYHFAAHYCTDQRVLEIGCGCGYGSYFLAHFARQVVALDIDANDIWYAAKHYRKNNLHFFTADALATGLPKDYFQTIVSLETFEHIPANQSQKFLHELWQLLAPSGVLILSTPNADVYQRWGSSAGHVNETTVKNFFALLHTIFPHCRPFYQRKGELERQKWFYHLLGWDRLHLRHRLPRRLKRFIKKRLTPERTASMDELWKVLQVREAASLEEVEQAVIQIAVCRKT